MVAIHPENVRTAATALRLAARQAADIETDLGRASILSELDASVQLEACAEINEELRLLATILVARADEAAGFYLPGSSWRTASTLLGTLLDDRGAMADMSLPLALRLLMEQAMDMAVDGSNPTTTNDPFDSLVFTVADLRRLAADPTSSPALAAAAALLAANPRGIEITRAWEGTGASLPSHGVDEIPLRDIQAFLARNDLLRQLFSGNNTTFDDLYAPLDDAALATAGVDPMMFAQLHLPRSAHDLMVAAIEHGTFNHSPHLAREFIERLPVHALSGQSIDIRSTDPEAIARLYAQATLDLGTGRADFMTRSLLVAFLPETTVGTRNTLITSNYAELAFWHNANLNGTTNATSPDYAGNNWFHMGVSASDSVRPVIVGSQQAFAGGPFPGFDTPAGVNQDIADGNQAIYYSFITAQIDRWNDEPLESQLLTDAYDLLDAAADTDDPIEAQHLVAESTVRFAIAEQGIVDEYVQLDGVGPLDRLGTYALSTLLLNPRSATQVMTDDGELSVEIDGDDLIQPMAIGEPVPPPQHSNNYIDRDALIGRLPADFNWTFTQADDWSDMEERLPIIEDIAILLLTEPALPRLVDHHRQGNLDLPQTRDTDPATPPD